MKKNDPVSLLMLLGSMVIYGSIGVFRRYIPLPSACLACFRGFAGAALLLLLAAVKKKRIVNHIGVKNVLGLVLSGGLMGFNWIFLFEAYNYTKVATATLCYYMQPTIIILLSPILFRERLTLKKGLCALAAIIGMGFVSGIMKTGLPQAGEAKGILFGLAAAALYASVIIMNKKLPGIDTYEKTIIQLASAAIVLLPYILITGESFSMEATTLNIVMLLIVGIVHTGIAYVLYFGSMDGLNAQTIAVFSYFDPIVAMLLSAIILRESMTVYEIFGAILIIGAAVLSELTLGKKHE